MRMRVRLSRSEAEIDRRDEVEDGTGNRGR